MKLLGRLNEIIHIGSSLVIQWLRLHTPNAGGPGLIAGQGTRSHMLQLRVPHAVTKDPSCCKKDQRSYVP